MKKQVYFGATCYIVPNTSLPSPHSKTTTFVTDAQNPFSFTLNNLKYSDTALIREVFAKQDEIRSQTSRQHVIFRCLTHRPTHLEWGTPSNYSFLLSIRKSLGEVHEGILAYMSWVSSSRHSRKTLVFTGVFIGSCFQLSTFQLSTFQLFEYFCEYK